MWSAAKAACGTSEKRIVAYRIAARCAAGRALNKHQPRKQIAARFVARGRHKFASLLGEVAVPSKAQALCAAIELAEKDGARGEAPEMLVRHEDDRYITEWVYG
jgi:hypothetical protein